MLTTFLKSNYENIYVTIFMLGTNFIQKYENRESNTLCVKIL